MDEPDFINDKPTFEERNLGYDISKSDVAINDALDRLLEYLRRLRRAGAETRSWTRHTLDHLEEKMAALDVLSPANSANAVLTDLVAWEGHIVQVIRHYMQEVSETINRLKTLNPPLTTHQLRPFIKAAEKDRQETVETLAPLTAAIEKLAAYKKDFSRR